GGRGSGPLVDAVDAIVVDHVADLGGARVHGHRRVVAVRAVGDIAHRGLAGDERVDKVAVAIVVGVCVPGDRGGITFVDEGVAVVVRHVADLGCVWVDRGVAVVTVGVVLDIP